MIREIRNNFENEEEGYYKSVGNCWSNNYIEHESNGDSNKTLSVEEYVYKIRPNIKDIINNLEKPDR